MTKMHCVKELTKVVSEEDSAMHFLCLHSIHLLRAYTVFVREQAQVQVCTLNFLSCVFLKVLTLLTLSKL